MSIPQAESKIKERLEDMLEAMMDLALGHFKYSVQLDKEKGEMVQKVYTVDPDYKALAFLLENVMGKVPQRVELTGDAGGPIKIIPYMAMAEALREGVLTMSKKDEPEEAEFREIADGPP